MKSHVINLYLKSEFGGTKEKMAKLTPEQLAFVDEVYALAEEHYDDGGDVIVETMEPWDILKKFKTLKDVRGYAGLWVEQNMNARCGNNDDPQVEMQNRFDNNWKE